MLSSRQALPCGRLALPLVVALALLTSAATATQRGGDPPTEPKKTTEFRGRLPAYYAKVVDPQQREEIYAIQKRFNTEIAKLQEELEKLLTERDAEVAAVLTSEQRQQVAKMVADAKARRQQAKKGSGSSSDDR